MSMNDERPGPVPGDAPDVVEKPKPASEGSKQPDAVTVDQDKPEASTTPADIPGAEATAEPKTETKVPKGVQERFDELTRDKHEAARQRDQWQRKAEELEAKLNAPATGADGKPNPNVSQPKPKPEDFPNSWDDYENALETWRFDEAERRVERKILQRQHTEATAKARETAEASYQTARERFDDLATKAAPKFEGLDKAIKNLFEGKIPNNDAMAEFIFEGDHDLGPELVFYLDANPTEAARIAKLSPLQTAAAMARLEAKLPRPEARTESDAPPPTKTVKVAGASDGYDPEKASTDENIERWRKAAAKKSSR